MKLEELGEALQSFACDVTEGSVVVSAALVVWEEVQFDEDGDVMRRVKYAIPIESTSMSAATGLATLACDALRRDINDE